MKAILYTNYLLLLAAPLAFLLADFGWLDREWPQYATMWLALYQLFVGMAIAVYRVFNRSNFLIWFYWLGVFLFFSVGLRHAQNGFPWYWPTLLVIYFSYVLYRETQIHYRHENRQVYQ